MNEDFLNISINFRKKLKCPNLNDTQFLLGMVNRLMSITYQIIINIILLSGDQNKTIFFLKITSYTGNMFCFHMNNPPNVIIIFTKKINV